MATYVDLNTVNNPTTGQPAPASWGDQIRENFEFLIDPPACSVYNNTTQSISDGSSTALTCNSEYFDNASWHSTVSATSRLTAPIDGRYLCVATIQWATNATGWRQLTFRVNGTTSYLCVQFAAVGASHTVIQSGNKLLPLTAGDYVEAIGFQDSGGSLNVTTLELGATFLTR